MACGTAVVLPDNKTVSHLVDGNGFLIEDGQGEREIASKIVDYSSRKEELSRMKDRSASLAQAYSWEDIAKESIEVYRER
jgi:glycosyltransferase involved in cell wall biosynthesis